MTYFNFNQAVCLFYSINKLCFIVFLLVFLNDTLPLFHNEYLVKDGEQLE